MPLQGLRLVMRTLGRTSPAIATQLAFRLFFRTQRFQPHAREAGLLARAQRIDVSRAGGGRLAAWTWGQRGPTVLLVHGWSGRGAQLGAMVDPLLDAGFRVVTFDAVGHGQSSGERATLVDIAEDVRTIERASGPFHAIVAHSAGSPCSAMALLSGVEASRLVMVAPPLSAAGFLDTFSAMVGVEDTLKPLLRQRVEASVGVDFDELDMRHIAHGLSLPALVVHDVDDREVSFDKGVKVARAFGATLHTTSGLGHHRILRDPQVIDTIVEFVRQPLEQQEA